MRFSVTVVDGASGQAQSVLIDAEPDHRIADLLPQLINTTGGAGAAGGRPEARVGSGAV